jgi:hypothetical protein
MTSGRCWCKNSDALLFSKFFQFYRPSHIPPSPAQLKCPESHEKSDPITDRRRCNTESRRECPEIVEVNQDHEKTGTGRAKRLANLSPPWSSENQPPGHTKSRKGIRNRKTILNHWMKAFEAQERMAAKAKAIKHRDAERKRRTAKKRAKELAAVFPRVVP